MRADLTCRNLGVLGLNCCYHVVWHQADRVQLERIQPNPHGILRSEYVDIADAWHAAGLASGGTTCEEPPGWRDGSVGRLYLAYLRDPDGNKLCALHRPAK